jgi:hypothetical protein
MLTSKKQRTTVHLVAAIVRQALQQLTSVYNDIIPGVIRAVQRDDDELREGCLQVRRHLSYINAATHQSCSTRLLRRYS